MRPRSQRVSRAPFQCLVENLSQFLEDFEYPEPRRNNKIQFPTHHRYSVVSRPLWSIRDSQNRYCRFGSSLDPKG